MTPEQKKRITHLSLGFLVVCFASACAVSKKAKMPQERAAYKTSSRAITIMSYNVENLFDNTDDPDKDDKTYLPLSKKNSDSHKTACRKIKVSHWRDQCLNWDWSDQWVDEKLRRLGAVIRSAKNGQGPDILVLQEVENLKILRRLVDEQLKGLNYKEVLLVEGKDLRGIDVAIVSRLEKVGKETLLQIPFKKATAEQKTDTRGLLKARFRLSDGQTLAIFAAHLPAPFHPTILRVEALKFLNEQQKIALKSSDFVVAAGDFNITSQEDDREHLIERFAHPQWIVSHRFGCGSCSGTSYHAPTNSWSFLDQIWMSKNLLDGEGGWRVPRESVRLLTHAHPEQSTSQGAPKATDVPEMSGISDHWPILLDLVPTIISQPGGS